MNRNNNIFNKKEVENKLKDFKEGQDYSVAREGKELIYNFHNNWLRDEFGRNLTTVYEVAENWDSDNFNHHREEGKYINSDKGTEITYRYEHSINKESGDYYNEWSRGQNFEDNSKHTWTLRGRPNPKRIEPNHDLKWKFNQLTDKLNSLLARPASDFGVNGKEKKDYEIAEARKDIAEIKRAIEKQENNIGNSRPQHWENCQRGQKFNKDKESWAAEDIRGGRNHWCSYECAEKYKNNPHANIEHCVPTWLGSDYDYGGDTQQKGRTGRNEEGSLAENSHLHKENQELRQQLSEVQKQLSEVLEELKKLKSSVNGKESEKLSQQIVQNERLVKEGKNVSVAEIQEQVNKSQALMNELNTTASVNKNDKGNGSLPYVIGGSVILAVAGIIGYLVVKNKSRTTRVAITIPKK